MILVIVGTGVVVLSIIFSDVPEGKERVVIEQNDEKNKGRRQRNSIISDNQHDLAQNLDFLDQVEKQ